MNRIASLLALFSLGIALCPAETLYRTDFEDFPLGDNFWAGFDDWVSNDTTSGAQAIDDGLFNGALGKTAAIGFNRPSSTFVSVFRSINYDPSVSGNPLLVFQTLFGIEDSTIATNFRRDDFFFSFYSTGGELLASIRISNTDEEYGFWRRDGNLQAGGTETDTGQDFIQGELHILTARIDLNANRWTATVDAIPIFEDVTFNGTGQSRVLGPVAAEWQIAGGSTFNYGDNWMLVADLSIETVDPAPSSLAIESILRTAAGDVTLIWRADPGFDYTVEYSHDLQVWFDDLPNSTVPSPVSEQTVEYTDRAATSLAGRYYRLRRTTAAE